MAKERAFRVYTGLKARKEINGLTPAEKAKVAQMRNILLAKGYRFEDGRVVFPGNSDLTQPALNTSLSIHTEFFPTSHFMTWYQSTFNNTSMPLYWRLRTDIDVIQAFQTKKTTIIGWSINMLVDEVIFVVAKNNSIMELCASRLATDIPEEVQFVLNLIKDIIPALHKDGIGKNGL